MPSHKEAYSVGIDTKLRGRHTTEETQLNAKTWMKEIKKQEML